MTLQELPGLLPVWGAVVEVQDLHFSATSTEKIEGRHRINTTRDGNVDSMGHVDQELDH